MISEEKIMNVFLGIDVKGAHGIEILKTFHTQLKNIEIAEGKAKEGSAARTNQIARATAATEILEKASIKLNIALKGQTGFLNQATIATGQLSGAMKGMTGVINSVADAFGAQQIGLIKGYNTLINYSKSLLQTSSQFTKYGMGIREVDLATMRLAKSTNLTREDTLGLMSSFEKAFPTGPIEDMESHFQALKDIVGGNIDAMKQLSEFIGTMANKFPDLDEPLKRLNTQDKEMIANKMLGLQLSKKISFEENKKFLDIISGSQNALSEEQKRINAINDIKRIYEDIALKIGTVLAPAMQKFAEWLKTSYDWIAGWIPLLTKAVIAFKAIEISLGVINGIKALSLVPGLGIPAGAAAMGASVIGAGAAAAGGSWLGGNAYDAIMGKPKDGEFSLGRSAASVGGSVLGGAGAGMLIGAVGGPIGMAAGAIIGAIYGIGKEAIGYLSFLASKKDKEGKDSDAKFEIEREKAQKIAEDARIAYGDNGNPADAKAMYRAQEKAKLAAEISAIRAEATADEKAYAEGRKQTTLGSTWLGEFQNSGGSERGQDLKQKMDRFKALSNYGPTLEAEKKITEQAKIQNKLAEERSNKRLKDAVDSMKRSYESETLAGKAEAQSQSIEASLALSAQTGASNKEIWKTMKEQVETQAKLTANRKKDLDLLVKMKTEEVAIAKENIRRLSEKRKSAKPGEEREKIDLEIAKQEAIDEAGTAAIMEATRLSKATDITKQLTAQIQQYRNMAQENKANVAYADAQLSKEQAMVDLSDSLGAGLSASIDMRMSALKASKDVTAQAQTDLELNEKAKAGIIEAMKAAGKSEAEIKKETVGIDTERLNIQTRILNSQKKSAELAKQMREGYISAISAMTAGTGVFTKIMVDQEKNLGVAVKGGMALSGMRAGGVAEGGVASGGLNLARFSAGGGLTDAAFRGNRQSMASGAGQYSEEIQQMQNQMRTMLTKMSNAPTTMGSSAYGSSPAAASEYLSNRQNVNVTVTVKAEENFIKTVKTDVSRSTIGPQGEGTGPRRYE